ncbi:hypothetical protein [Roseibium sp. MMSF_3412]|uniref:hypothetical protein n=1 Tax=Roseibium sp. MMSF_3412 TaxID=3046712 RepID=UPI00273F7536|nr:hypothetical protein [Roseibium sp. MMSF_3412]
MRRQQFLNLVFLLPFNRSQRGRAGLRSRSQPAIFLVLSVLLGACAGNLVTDSGVYYNRGLESSYNDLLLANVIRSAKGLPTYFSAVGDYSANADMSISNDFSLSGELGELFLSDLDLSTSTSRDFGRNANVSSLESETFVQAMLTPLSPKLFFLLAEGRSRQRLDLLSVLAVKWILIPEATVVRIRTAALEACSREAHTYSRELRAVCSNYPQTVAEAACAGPLRPNSQEKVLLRSDPSNHCSHVRFRHLMEAITILQPALLRNSAPGAITLIAQEQLHQENTASGKQVAAVATTKDGSKNSAARPTRQDASSTALIFGKDSDYALRSPNEILQYLGGAVRAMHRHGSGPRLIGPDGRKIPVFEVVAGPFGLGSAIDVRVDGERFGIRTHRLTEDPGSFTVQSLAILKDIISINTSQNVLPKNPTVFLR